MADILYDGAGHSRGWGGVYSVKTRRRRTGHAGHACHCPPPANLVFYSSPTHLNDFIIAMPPSSKAKAKLKPKTTVQVRFR